MGSEKKLSMWLENHDGEEHCKYCIYDDECPHGMACYGGTPIEPYCTGREPEKFLDIDAILDEMDEIVKKS